MVLSVSTRFSILFTLTLCGLFLVSACGKTGADQMSPPVIKSAKTIKPEIFRPDLHDWPHDVSDIAPDSRVKYGRLKNGLRYAVLPETDGLGFISVQLNMDVGFNQEPEALYGIAHLLEHMAFHGKGRGEDGSIIHDLEAGGVGFGSGLNAFTSMENTRYDLNLSDSGKTTLESGLNSLKSLIDISELTQENMDAEKRVVLAELKSRDTTSERSSRSYRAFKYPNNPRYKVGGTGTEETLEAITLADLKAFKAAYYRPENGFLVISGNVNLRKTERNIKKIFSDWPVSKTKSPRFDSAKQGAVTYLPETTIFNETRSKPEVIAVEHRPSTSLPDSFEARRRGFVEKMIHYLLQRRITQRITADPDVNNVAFIQSRTDAHDLIGVNLSGDDLGLAMTIFEEERRIAVEFGFTSEEVDYVTASWRADFERADTASGTISALAVSGKIRRGFKQGNVYNNPQQELAIFNEIMKSLKLEDYNRAAQDMWTDFDPKYWIKSSKSTAGTLAEVKAARAEVAERVLSAPEVPKSKPFVKAEFGQAGIIESRDRDRASNINRLLFENNVRLNYKIKKDSRDGIVILVALQAPSGELVNAGYAGIVERAASLSRADIQGVDADNMNRQFVGTETDFGVSVNEDRLVLSLFTNRESLQDGLDVMSTFLANFDLDSEDYQRRFKNKTDRSKRRGNQSPVTEGTKEIGYAYTDKSDAFRSMSANSFVFDEDIQAHIEKILTSSSIEVGVSGDFDAQTLEDAFAASFGAMPTRPDVITGPVEKNKGVMLIDPGMSSLTYSGSNEQMALFYCHPTPEADAGTEFSDRYLLSKIAQNRLRESVRMDLGLSYSQGAFRQSNRVFPNAGFACLYAQFDPDNEIPAHESFREVISSFQTSPITKTELKRAREPFLSRAKMLENSDYGDALLASSAYSEPEMSQEIESALKAIKKMKLIAANKRAREFYDLSNFHVFRVQHVQSRPALRRKTLKIESQLSGGDPQIKMGKYLLLSQDEADHQKGIELLNQLGAGGLKDAYFELGDYHALQYNLEAAAKAYELSGPTPESAVKLSALYYDHYKRFPDVEDAHIIELARLGAESGDAEGQRFLAERLKQGTYVEQDEIEALKWALIANHTKKGVLTFDNEGDIERFETGLPETDIQAARRQAESWVLSHPK